MVLAPPSQTERVGDKGLMQADAVLRPFHTNPQPISREAPAHPFAPPRHPA